MNAFRIPSTIAIQRVNAVGCRRFSYLGAPPIAPWLKLAPDTPGMTISTAMANPNNPRSLPRALVWFSAASLFGFFATRFVDHSLAMDNTNIIRVTAPPSTSNLTKKMSDSLPIIFNAEKYKTLRKKGLGTEDH